MKKVLILLAVLLVGSSFQFVKAQDSNFVVDKPQRKVFLWDVTLSMKGAGGCPNIWNEVKENLIKEIKSVTDPKMEIVVLPFQHRIIDKKSEYATAEGKLRLIQFVNDFELPRMWIGDAKTGHEENGGKGKTTMTKLYAPLKESLETVISSDKTDILVFLTDGLSDFSDDAAAFEKFVCEEWCTDVAEEKDIYAFYLMLTPKAINDKLNDCKCGRFKIIKPGTTIPGLSTVTLTPASKVCYNVKDDFGKDIVVKFDTKSSTPMEAGFKIHVENDSENPYFEINEDVDLDPVRNTISIRPRLKMTREEMRSYILEKDENKDVLFLSFSVGKGMEEKYDRVIVTTIKTEVEMVGTDERTLKMEWK